MILILYYIIVILYCIILNYIVLYYNMIIILLCYTYNIRKAMLAFGIKSLTFLDDVGNLLPHRTVYTWSSPTDPSAFISACLRWYVKFTSGKLILFRSPKSATPRHIKFLQDPRLALAVQDVFLPFVVFQGYHDLPFVRGVCLPYAGIWSRGVETTSQIYIEIVWYSVDSTLANSDYIYIHIMWYIYALFYDIKLIYYNMYVHIYIWFKEAHSIHTAA